MTNPFQLSNLSVANVSELLERLVADKRFRIGAAICGAIVFLTSMTLLGLSTRPMHKASTMVVSVLPDTPYKIQILRHLPDPQPMLPRAARSVGLTTRVAHAKASPMIARRR